MWTGVSITTICTLCALYDAIALVYYVSFYIRSWTFRDYEGWFVCSIRVNWTLEDRPLDGVSHPMPLVKGYFNIVLFTKICVLWENEKGKRKNKQTKERTGTFLRRRTTSVQYIELSFYLLKWRFKWKKKRINFK